MTDSYLSCRACSAAAGELVRSTIERRPFADRDGGEFVCDGGHVIGVYLDGGELDLGIVR